MSSGGVPEAIEMYPAPTGFYHPTQNVTAVPTSLERAFTSAVDSYNSKNYIATAVLCRRTLEGIFKHLAPEGSKHHNLAKLIEDAKSNVDLAAPLNELSHSLRTGGNLGAHFDENAEPTHEMARKMVELLEYLISYLFVLPERIKELEAELGKE
ncbi:MAG: DUF4145 domain-containing protein [Verrucomicrobiaceae bacterium]|nr:MAG: DUF4145 domain-containing protein [Verrucomicrobiaceae bacterium]